MCFSFEDGIIIFSLPLSLLSLSSFLEQDPFRKYFLFRLYLVQTMSLPEHKQNPKAFILAAI